MKGLIQRVSHASVVVEGETVGSIDRGLLLLLGVEKHDTEVQLDKLLNKIIAYRVFPDEAGHMNLSLRDMGGELLVVSQFTLAADTQKGLRPSFSSAAHPDDANRMYELFVHKARALVKRVETGRFGADMKVSLLNDGPVTFLLESAPAKI
ncbi:MAG: D-tyrosyl-tRNA(Tyr) deacylase [Pseudomonadales bacterium]|nr:D-tyrosyl-tRNA(Tyr) deacylase [Pseudomonadales bacterium]